MQVPFTTETLPIVGEPEFSKIISAMTEAISDNKNLTDSLTRISEVIKPMTTHPEPQNAPQMEPSCLVDFLWMNISRLRETNMRLDRAVIHLQQTIGI